MITTNEQKFLKNFTTMANVINHIDEDGILKVERREGDLVVLKQDYLCSGCGECVKWCPVHAITVRPVKPITVYRKVR